MMSQRVFPFLHNSSVGIDLQPSTSDVELGSIKASTNVVSRLHAWAYSLSVETGGIERVTDENLSQKTTPVWNACAFW
jgi:hypothetical protein